MGRLLAVVIWVITIASVWMFVSGKWWFPESISEHGPRYDSQFLITIIVVGISFAAAQIGLGWAVWKFRDTANAQRATYSHGNNRLEVVWTVVTAIIFISLAVMGQRVWASLHLNAPPPGSLQIEVVAQQFSWNFHYAGQDKVFGRTDPGLIDDSALNFVGIDDTDPNSKDDAVVSTLIIPANRPVELILRSKDVTHSFWVPQLRRKIDAISGSIGSGWISAQQAGIYRGVCSEFCGLQHARMQLLVQAMPQARFAEWVRNAQRAAPQPSTASERAGRDVFTHNACATCHTIRGTTAGGNFGPDLTHVGSRPAIAGAVLANTPGNMGGWIADPQHVKPGAEMPAVPLNGTQLRDVIAYLESLR